MSSKYFIRFFLSLILSASVLAPTIVAFTDAAEGKFVVIDTSDEESGKETEKKNDEKELFFETIHKNTDNSVLSLPNLEKTCSLKYQAVDFEIILPPPEVSTTFFI